MMGVSTVGGELGAGRRILVADDDPSIRDLVATALSFVGFEIVEARDGIEALELAAAVQPDLLVLDVMMPRLDGFEVCTRLRAGGDRTPVVFLTAKDTPADMVAGFGVEGDDYLTKPFHLQVLIARIEAVLRRVGPIDERQPAPALRYADVTVDDAAHRVWRGDQLVNLSPTEFKLLHYLLVHAGRVLSKGQIVDHIWQYDFGGDHNIVETHMSALRRKLGEPRLIHTVRGVGYVLRHEP